MRFLKQRCTEEQQGGPCGIEQKEEEWGGQSTEGLVGKNKNLGLFQIEWRYTGRV